MRTLAAVPLALVFLLPLAASLLFMVPDAVNAEALRELVAHPQFPGALRLSLFTGLASTLLALVAALAIIFAAGGGNLAGRAGVFLAVPHLSLAIGLAFLLMPTGIVARLLAPLMGWTTPPQWVATQDPWGLSLIAALVLKETPFLIWAFASLLNRDDLRRLFEGQQAVARSLGHGASSTFLRILLPQLLPRAMGPLIAVLAYGLTVVDMALVIGPTQPPTLAQLVWTDINDADPAVSARGGAGVIVLGLVVALAVVLSACVVSILKLVRQRVYGAAPRAGRDMARLFAALWPACLAVYAAAVVLMLVQSVAARWPFPNLLPEAVTLKAWSHLAASPAPVLTSLTLALACTTIALVATVAWLEWAPRRADRVMTAAAILVLCLPALLLALGEYRLFLALGVTGTATSAAAGPSPAGHGLCLPAAGWPLSRLRSPMAGHGPRLAGATPRVSAPHQVAHAEGSAPVSGCRRLCCLGGAVRAGPACGGGALRHAAHGSRHAVVGRKPPAHRHLRTRPHGPATGELPHRQPPLAPALEHPLMLALHDIAITLADGTPLFRPFSLDVAAGETVTLMGPSGSGKSSLLSFIGGDLTSAMTATGRVTLNGTDILPLPPERRRIARLFQDDLLFPHMTVGENLLFAIPKAPQPERHAKMQQALADAGLEGFANRPPHTLSGGQRARVALMRALAGGTAGPAAGRTLRQARPGFTCNHPQLYLRSHPRPRHPSPSCDARS
jgi:putative thiamine transport system permease protein